MVVRWSAGIGSMPGWLIAGVLWFGALPGCALFDESLLNETGLGGPAGGTGGRASAGAGGTRADGGAAPDIDGGMRPPVAGSSAPGNDGAVPRADSGVDDDADVEETPPNDGGVLDAAPPDGAPPDAGDPPICTPAAGDYCSQLEPLLAAPVIDGELDCGPAAVAITPVGWNGTTAMPSTHSARVAAAWRPNGIYVYVEVNGTSTPHPSGTDIYCGDAVELYVDHDGTTDASGNYADPGTRQFVVAAPSAASPGTIEAFEFSEGNNHGTWETTDLRTVRRADGYQVEAFITASDLDLTAWAPGPRIGLDVAIDVAAPAGTAGLRCGVLSGQYFLRVGPTAGSGCDGEPWCDARAFCTPLLVVPGD